MELQYQIEAILFYQAEPLSVARLAKLLKRTEGEIRDALTALDASLSGRGLRLVQNGNEVMLGTAPEASALIEAITKEELARDLSKSAMETLSIVLYKGPIARSEIDYIRGVNSTFILRNLLVRGLIEKVENPNDQRSFLYKPTFQLLEFMGVTKTEDLPNYQETLAAVEQFMTSNEDEEPAEIQSTASREQPTSAESAELSMSDIVGEESADELSLDADIMEENEAGANYDDEALRAHRNEDEAAAHPESL